MRTYYKTPEGDIGVFWSRSHATGTATVKLRMPNGDLINHEADALIWCTRNGVPKK